MQASMQASMQAPSTAIDFERFRLRRFLESLPPEEFQRHEAAIDLADIASVLEGNPRAVLFEHAGPEGLPLAGGVCGSRARLAAAFDSTPQQVVHAVMQRLRTRQEVVDIDPALAPVRQVVLQDDAADLTRLPVNLQHALDGAPYISASTDYVIDPASGWTNIGVRRLMLRGRRETGIDLLAPSDLRAIYEGHVRRGEPMQVAFVVGSHPIDHVAATMRVPMDELSLLAALRGAPLPVVKCLTSDIRVPADAEYVIEGVIDAAGYTEEEGPYGEFLGYYGAVKRNPVFRVTAITHRRDALFQTATISGRSIGRSDTAQLNSLRAEVVMWRALETAVREVHAVYASPAAGGALNARVAIRQRVPGEARNAIAAIFGCLANVKHVFVVDEDVNVYEDEQIDWALATRFQANHDLVVQSGMRAMPIDPSIGPERTWSKAGFDLTLPFLRPGETRRIDHRLAEPPTYSSAGLQPAKTVEQALAQGALYFEQLMALLGSRDGREIVLALDALRQTGRLVRDEEGRYALQAKQGKQ